MSTWQTVTFDGHKFDGQAFGQFGWAFYLASKARRGDAEAAALLDAFRVSIETLEHGVYYWPLPSPAPAAEVREFGLGTAQSDAANALPKPLER